MPCNEDRIMKLDPNNGDAISSVGDDLGDYYYKYNGTVVGIDGCVCGIPYYSKRIMKYDPINDITSLVGEEADEEFCYSTDGVLGRNGCIYALDKDGRLLKIDMTNNTIHIAWSETRLSRIMMEMDGAMQSWGLMVASIGLLAELLIF